MVSVISLCKYLLLLCTVLAGIYYAFLSFVDILKISPEPTLMRNRIPSDYDVIPSSKRPLFNNNSNHYRTEFDFFYYNDPLLHGGLHDPYKITTTTRKRYRLNAKSGIASPTEVTEPNKAGLCSNNFPTHPRGYDYRYSLQDIPCIQNNISLTICCIQCPARPNQLKKLDLNFVSIISTIIDTYYVDFISAIVYLSRRNFVENDFVNRQFLIDQEH